MSEKDGKPKTARLGIGNMVLVPLRGEMQTGIIQDEHVTYGVKVYDDEGYPEYHVWGCNLVKPIHDPTPDEQEDSRLPMIGERVYATYGTGLGTVGVIWDDGTTTKEWNSPHVARWPQGFHEPKKD